MAPAKITNPKPADTNDELDIDTLSQVAGGAGVAPQPHDPKTADWTSHIPDAPSPSAIHAPAATMHEANLPPGTTAHTMSNDDVQAILGNLTAKMHTAEAATPHAAPTPPHTTPDHTAQHIVDAKFHAHDAGPAAHPPEHGPAGVVNTALHIVGQGLNTAAHDVPGLVTTGNAINHTVATVTHEIAQTFSSS